MIYGAFDYGKPVYQVEPQITYAVAGSVTKEIREHLAKALAHATHVDWEQISDDVWECNFDREWEDRFLDFARDCDGIEYHAVTEEGL